MALYAYRAMDAAGRIVTGQADAGNLLDLEWRLARMGLDYISGEPAGRSARSGRGVARRELIHFFFHLEQLLRAGVPMIEALTELRASTATSRLYFVIADMIDAIEGGQTLSQAAAQHPRVFGEVVAQLLHVGEQSGKLPEVVGELVANLKWQDELAARTRQLLMYPAFLGMLMLGLTLFLLTYLVPRLTGFVKGMGHALPPHTEVLLAVSAFVAAYWYLLVLAPLAVLAALGLLLRQRPELRYYADRAKLGLPWLGRILRRIVLARFARAFALMYASGIAILDALHASERAIGNLAVARGVQRAAHMVSAGASVSAAFEDAKLFPPLVIRMLRVGESTGELDVALANIGYFYGRDVEESIERAQTLVEPVLTVALGLVMGWIMLSVFGPLYDIMAGLRI